MGAAPWKNGFASTGAEDAQCQLLSLQPRTSQVELTRQTPSQRHRRRRVLLALSVVVVIVVPVVAVVVHGERLVEMADGGGPERRIPPQTVSVASLVRRGKSEAWDEARTGREELESSIRDGSDGRSTLETVEGLGRNPACQSVTSSRSLV